jgi:hypothetical protein
MFSDLLLKWSKKEGFNLAHRKSRSYNLKNCNFFFGARLVPGFGENGMF